MRKFLKRKESSEAKSQPCKLGVVKIRKIAPILCQVYKVIFMRIISLQNLHIDSKTYIFSITIKSLCPKCIFWWMFQLILMGLYCLHVSAATGCVLQWVIMAWFQEGAYGTVWYKVDFPPNPLHRHSAHVLLAYPKGTAMEYFYIVLSFILFFLWDQKCDVCWIWYNTAHNPAIQWSFCVRAKLMRGSVTL